MNIKRINPKYNTFIKVLILILSYNFNVHAQWVQKGGDMDGEAAEDRLGYCVRLSSDGNTVAMGGYVNDGNGLDAGHVKVYTWNGSSWVQKGSDIDGEAAGDLSGYYISLSNDGNTVAIGAEHNTGNGTQAGHTRVYRWNGASWGQLGSDIDAEAAGDNAGISVSLAGDGNTVAIGARDNDGAGSNSGHVRVYTWNGSSWVQKGGDIDGEAAGDNLGITVCLSSDGNILAAGASKNDGAGADAGHVRVYSWNGTAWSQRGSDIDGEAANDLFGSALDLSSAGDVLAVGAYANDGNGFAAGHARVYDWNGSSWSQRGPDFDGETASDLSGYSVALSSSGDVLAIGEPRNDENGSNAGRIKVFSWDGVLWTQVGSNILGEKSPVNMGTFVSLSDNGGTLAGGGPFDNAAGSNAGHVRVYNNPVLPIELITFSARWNSKEQTEALIEWQTDIEINNEFFYVERSTDAIYFEDVARIDGAGTTHETQRYTFIDDGLPADQKVFFYRLRQEDFDGAVTHSKVDVLQKEEGVSIITLYPNPNFGQFQFILSSSIESNALVTIMDYRGRVVKKEELNVVAGINNVSINIEEIRAASYVIRVETENGLYEASTRFVMQEK